MIGTLEDFTKQLQNHAHEMKHKSQQYILLCLNPQKHQEPLNNKQIQDLLSLLEGADLSIKESLLLEIQAAKKIQIESILPRLKHDELEIRLQAIQQLFSASNSSLQGHLETLIECLQDSSSKVRDHAALLISRLDSLEPLRFRLSAGSASERQSCAWALGNMGLKAKAAVPDLIDALRDSHDAVRKAAAWALEAIFTQPTTAENHKPAASESKNEPQSVKAQSPKDSKPQNRGRVRWRSVGKGGAKTRKAS